MGSEFKVYTNPLYGEEFDIDQLMFCQDVQQGSLHGVINPLFEEHMELLDLVENDLNTDTLSYCYKRSSGSSSECDGESIDEIASHDMNNKVFDEMVIKNQHAQTYQTENETLLY